MSVLQSRNEKYKDEQPINTINTILYKLSNLGIKPLIAGWQNSVEGFHSINIMLPNTNISTNGKGTTYVYAMASALGEMMERLQNQSFFRLNLDLNPKVLEYKGFYYAPDEKYLSINELMNSKEEWINYQFKKMNQNINRYELLSRWKNVSYEKVPADFAALPYMNLRSKKISYIPVKMITKMYMSNGMCAGNSPEEALVQGISEILERHSNKEIIYKKLTPPDIPREFINKYPIIRDMIARLEMSGNFKVIIKDCSLNQGYPVTAVIFINKENQTYFAKFGSHPAFEISVERTLTELMQGQNIRFMMGMKGFTYHSEIENQHENLLSVFVAGSGNYPSEFFGNKVSYDFKEFKSVSNMNNKDMLSYLSKLIVNKGYDIYVRDVSFLGFPSYHVIIPGLSEIDEFDDINSINDYVNYNYVKRRLRGINVISQKEMLHIIDFIKHSNPSANTPVTQLLNLPINNTIPWYYSDFYLFITAIYLKIGNYVEASKSINTYIKNYQFNSTNYQQLAYYKCARDYIGTMIDNLEYNEAVNFLGKFYPTNIIKAVITDFDDPDHIVSRYGHFSCWNCDKCKLNFTCSYRNVENIYIKMKEQYSIAGINQVNLANLLNS